MRSTMPGRSPKETRTYPVFLLALGLSLSACDEPAGPTTSNGPSTGTLVISTTTGGDDPDRDGYLLTVDNVDSLDLEPKGTTEVGLAPGRHALHLLGVADQCSVAPGTSLDVEITSQSRTSVAFNVNCAATGARVTVTTTGLDLDPDGYRVVVDGSDRGAVASNGTVLIQLEPGSRTIGLTSLTANCGSASQMVTIVAGEVAPIEAGVVCTAATGVIGVAISGTGVGAVFEAMIDGATLFPVGRIDRAYLGGVSAGNHLVSLNAPAGCSVKTGPLTVSVTVGTLVRDTVEVTFSVICVVTPGPRIAFVRRAQPGPDGKPGPPDIYLANTDGSGVARLTSGENPAWSPDGRRIAFYREGTIHVIDADGSNERSIRSGLLPAWSPDGTRIAFVTGDGDPGGGIFVMNADGSGLTRLIRRDFAHPGSGDWTGWPQWSPDGRRISFVLAPDYDSYQPWEIYVMNPDGSDPRNLNVLRSVGGSFAETHSWSPDGSRIALAVDPGNSWTIASVNSSGADFRVHYRDERGGIAGHPDWSPDGRTLVFEKFKTTTGCEKPSCPMRIFVVSAAGGPARQLIPELAQGPDYWDEQPAWSRVNE